MPVQRHAADLVQAAYDAVSTLDVDAARRRFDTGDALFVDVRDPRELKKDGRIPGAFHCPRGMLEFWLDPDSPYHRSELDEPRPLIFFCRSGWRSALAAKAAQDMGREQVAHLDGGFEAWAAAEAPVDDAS